ASTDASKGKAGKAKKDAFAKEDIYYDAKANPRRHIKAFYLICQLLEEKGAKSMQCFPLRTSWIYSHMHVDAIVLRQQVIKNGPSDCPDPWGKVVDLTACPFKSRSEHSFAYSADTDGVAISLLFKTNKAKTRGHKKGAKGGGNAANSGDGGDGTVTSNSKSKTKKAKKPMSCTDPSKESPRIDGIPHEELLATSGNSVVMDPGRRDLHTYLHEESMPEKPRRFRYTTNQRAKETRMRKFAHICDKVKRAVKDNAVQKAENMLQKACRSTLDPAKFEEYIRIRAEVWPVLEHFYNKTTTTHADSTHQMHAKYVPTNLEWSKCKKRKMAPYADRTAQSHPLHRKLRLSAYWN
ncbi:hypothetical protein GGH99_008653, partial [Coemansia sp. RSA 1285]